MGIKITWTNNKGYFQYEIIHWSGLDKIIGKMVDEKKYLVFEDEKLITENQVFNENDKLEEALTIPDMQPNLSSILSEAEKVNYKYREDLVEGGVKKKYQNNVAAIQVLKKIEMEKIAQHDLDCPWRPSDLEQRAGRTLRQGNMNEEVSMYRYVTKDTFDSYNWQLVEQKQKFIAQVMTNKTVDRTCEDIDETVLSYAEVKALATGNPYIKEKMDIDTEVARLKMLKAGFLNEKYKYEDGFHRKYPEQIADYQAKIVATEKDIKLRDEHPIGEDNFQIKLYNAVITERPRAGETLVAIMTMNELSKEIGSFRGFHLLSISSETSQNRNNILVEGNRPYTIELGTSGVGNIYRLENVLNGLEEKLEMLKENLSISEDNLKEAEKNCNKTFLYEEELGQKMKRQMELNQLLELDKKDEVLADVEMDMEKGKMDSISMFKKVTESIISIDEEMGLEM